MGMAGYGLVCGMIHVGLAHAKICLVRPHGRKNKLASLRNVAY